VRSFRVWRAGRSRTGFSPFAFRHSPAATFGSGLLPRQFWMCWTRFSPLSPPIPCKHSRWDRIEDRRGSHWTCGQAPEVEVALSNGFVAVPARTYRIRVEALVPTHPAPKQLQMLMAAELPSREGGFLITTLIENRCSAKSNGAPAHIQTTPR
jgi:hypothetical protein